MNGGGRGTAINPTVICSTSAQPAISRKWRAARQSPAASRRFGGRLTLSWMFDAGPATTSSACGARSRTISAIPASTHGVDMLNSRNRRSPATPGRILIAPISYNLSFASASFDIVVCSNVLLCLPDIVKPLRELIRVARKTVLIRFLCHERTYLIRDVHPGDPDLDENGEPHAFNY